MSKTVTVRYFAMFREKRGLDDETIATDARSAAELFDLLSAKFGFAMPRSHVRVALNQEFKQFEDEISDGDEIVFVPPVAGG